jgi:GDP-mannose 6-dehydrogenase
MNISIFGIGYVGVTSAAYFADRGDSVTLVDVNKRKIELINQGKSPIDNDELRQLVEKNWKEGRIFATDDSEKAIKASEISIISVGTPADNEGEVDLISVYSVFSSIGYGLRNKNDYHLIILRSTSPPGTTRRGLDLVENLSGKKAGVHFGGCMSPEFLRGWSLVNDFRTPPFTVIGQFDKKSGDLAESLYRGINAELIRTELETAEMVKYVCNTYHALKTAFANEIGRTCKHMGIDAREVMDIFMKDTKLSVSTSYLKPGFAFGGSCLPKDVQALTKLSEQLGANSVLLKSILESNNLHIDYLVSRVLKLNAKKVGIIGITYHKDSDDLRNSQVIELAKRLIGKQLSVLIYDNVDFNNLLGANKDFVEALPFTLKDLFVFSLEELIETADVLIIAHAKPGLEELIRKLSQNKYCIDLGDLYHSRNTFSNYDGICW